MHTHGDGLAVDHSHGGSGRGLGWELLDSVMLGCFVVVACILSEVLYKTWRARRDGVRYNLTPQGAAVTMPDPEHRDGDD